MKRRIRWGNRFENRKHNAAGLEQLVVPAATFAVVLVLVLFGIRMLGGTADEEQLKNLESSIQKSAVQCYALEGRYPESLSYLMDHYGVTYDESRYTVSYEVYGPNILPSISVLPAGQDRVTE